MSEPEFQLKRPTFSIKVYPKYIEITDRSKMFGFLFPKTITVLTKNISSVDIARATETLLIRTTDGLTFKFRVGGAGGSAKSVQEAILKTI